MPDIARRACEKCGTVYTPTRWWQKFCSAPCREQNTVEKHRERRANPDHSDRRRERYATDPEYREKVLARNREAYAKRKAAAGG